jgi:exosome complex component RRP41
VNISPFAGTERRKRQRNDRRLQELGLLLQRTFQQAILDHLHPRTEIVAHLNVIAQDGGMVGACFNALTLALIDAGVPMYNYVSACGVAVYDTTPLLDPNHAEESDLSFLSIAVIGDSDKVASLLLENKLPMARLEAAMGLAIGGCHSIRGIMDREVRRHGRERVLKTSTD